MNYFVFLLLALGLVDQNQSFAKSTSAAALQCKIKSNEPKLYKITEETSEQVHIVVDGSANLTFSARNLQKINVPGAYLVLWSETDQSTADEKGSRMEFEIELFLCGTPWVRKVKTKLFKPFLDLNSGWQTELNIECCLQEVNK